MQPHVTDRFLNPVKEGASTSVTNYLATDEGHAFPENALTAVVQYLNSPLLGKPGELL